VQSCAPSTPLRTPQTLLRTVASAARIESRDVNSKGIAGPACAQRRRSDHNDSETGAAGSPRQTVSAAPTFRLGVPAALRLSASSTPHHATGVTTVSSTTMSYRRDWWLCDTMMLRMAPPLCQAPRGQITDRPLIHTGRGVPNAAEPAGLSEASLIVETAMPVDSGDAGTGSVYDVITEPGLTAAD
jgi:hypothetical protein